MSCYFTDTSVLIFFTQVVCDFGIHNSYTSAWVFHFLSKCLIYKCMGHLFYSVCYTHLVFEAFTSQLVKFFEFGAYWFSFTRVLRLLEQAWLLIHVFFCFGDLESNFAEQFKKSVFLYLSEGINYKGYWPFNWKWSNEITPWHLCWKFVYIDVTDWGSHTSLCCDMVCVIAEDCRL